MTNSISTPDTSDTPIRVRIAPSPTGDPHVGTAYIGLINYLYARQRDGKFVLRIEDTDRTRFVATSEQEIFHSLRWLGLTWDEGPDLGGPYGPYRQSERTEIYRQHVELLLANGTAYRAFETPEELEALRQRQIAAKLPPRYDGGHRQLSQLQIDAYLAEGRPFVVRMKVPAGQTTFRDELRGDITFDHNNVDDQVLMKSDGFPTYHLANVVDDHLMHITDVIRAEEWISSTPKHVLLYNAFGWAIPRFWHMPLLRNLDKSKISKRKNPVSLIYYRQAGFLPEAMINFLGLMGGGMPAPTAELTPAQPAATKSSETDIFTLPDMVTRFDVKNIRLGGPVFDLTKLKWLNGEYIRALTPEAFYKALRDTILSDAYLQQIAPLIQTRVETLGEFGNLTHFLFADDIMPPSEVFIPKKRTIEDALAFAAEQLTVLEATDWTHEALEPALKQLGEAQQWSVKENFMLLRAILTGSTMSPPLLESMIVFGKSRTLDRVRRFLETQKKLANTKK
ncbi:glutamate--tRNA ligase [Tunturibacter empetritectus]|uniref:Glutamate--tRNA ligase n=1 Tax=Tunturiibacter lichenicola TaxID=2051959 RepID=A0A7W8J7F2_9BACT|nr:glutamate--tRNA ligase [Edaphobacter lichenicola]MBB5343989.1 glutamyl-tRNA synthetase [Edaphobacter lichenicola]